MSTPPPPPPRQHHHHRHVVTTYIIPPLAGVTATFSLLTLLLFLFRRLRRETPQQQQPPFPRRYSFSSLRRATSNFHPSRRLGIGSSSSVFSASLNHLPLAVKLLRHHRDFLSELRVAEKISACVNSVNSVRVNSPDRVDSDRVDSPGRVDSVDPVRVVRLLGYAASSRGRGKRMCLVYEMMENGSLQDCLLHRKQEELMTWRARHAVAIDVAKGLAFLHHECHPPVIHGDVKPSNVLLDSCFVAKIADFGLARFKLVDTDNNDNNVSGFDDNVGNVVVGDGSNEHEVVINVNDSESALETESVTTTTVGFEDGSVVVDQSPVRVQQLEVETSPEIVTGEVSESDVEGNVRGWEWWRKRENDGGRGRGGGRVEEGKVKEYVMEWMGMEVARERPENDWNVGGASSSALETKKAEKKKGKKKMEWWMTMDDRRALKKERRKPVREWWKDEYSEELAKKKKKKKKKKDQGVASDHEENWWPRDEAMYIDENRKKSRRSRMSSRSSVDWWLDGLSGDHRKARHISHDSMSGEIPKSGGICSTPSMRGTVCYIAPEYSMGGDLSEKCDVYSFGVLMLVLISGRRPLQVTGSPMSEFHKANLLSWARQLARSGKLLNLVDNNICFLDKEQAEVCLLIALSCLQKSPARRPSMKEVVGMLTGDLPPPELPVEYSPAYTSKYPKRSRKKLR